MSAIGIQHTRAVIERDYARPVTIEDLARSARMSKFHFIRTFKAEIHTDATMDNGFRWLTVTAPDQPDLEIVLMEPKAGPMFDEESAAALKGVIASRPLPVPAPIRSS